jgi:hypothetical protein
MKKYLPYDRQQTLKTEISRGGRSQGPNVQILELTLRVDRGRFMRRMDSDQKVLVPENALAA